MEEIKTFLPSIAIIARIDSTRYPGKVIQEINGKSFLVRIIERVSLSKMKDKVFLAIPENSENDILRDLAIKNNIVCYRGSNEDVLSRIYNLCNYFKCQNIVRINGDCPFIDPFLIDDVIRQHLFKKNDYTSNILKETFPTGMHIEVINFKTLKKAHNFAKEKIEREHVTPYIYNKPNIFKIGSYTSEKDNSDIRVCVDYPEDFIMAKNIIKETNDKILKVDELANLIRKNKYLLDLCRRFNKKQSIKYK